MLDENLSASEMEKKKLCAEAIAVLKASDARTIVMETAKWLAAHVESYIDNHEVKYSLTFGDVDPEHFPVLSVIEKSIMAAVAAGPQTANPQKEVNLEDEVEMMNMLTEKMAEATRIGRDDKSLFTFLFDRLKFYYETILGFRDGKLAVKEVDGYIDLRLIEFDSNAMTVSVVRRVPGKEDQTTTVEMRPSFIVDFELIYMDKKIEMGLF